MTDECSFYKLTALLLNLGKKYGLLLVVLFAFWLIDIQKDNTFNKFIFPPENLSKKLYERI